MQDFSINFKKVSEKKKLLTTARPASAGPRHERPEEDSLL